MLLHARLQELDRRAREDPHVGLAVARPRLDREHALDRAGDRDARVAGAVAVAVARRPAGPGLGEAPRRAQALADLAGLDLRVRLAAGADALDGVVVDPEQRPARDLGVDDAAADEVRGGAGDGEERR